MEKGKLDWCFKLKDGLRIAEPNERLAKSYLEEEEIVSLYKKAFRNVDLRFKSLKESEIENFVEKLIRDLRILKNRIA